VTVLPSDKPTSERFVTIVEALNSGFTAKAGFQPWIDKIEQSHPELAERARRHEGVLRSLVAGLTWGECNICGRGRFLKTGASSTNCNLRYGCTGRVHPAKKTVKRKAPTPPTTDESAQAEAEPTDGDAAEIQATVRVEPGETASESPDNDFEVFEEM
jgi:hypothetical protein